MINYYYRIIRNIENILNIFIIVFFKFKYIFFKDTPYPKIAKTDTIVLLGNGPSLAEDFESILQEKQNAVKIMAVNLSIFSDFFDVVKPDFYILQDPAFFRSDVEEKVIEIQKSLVTAFINKVTWKMNLIVPPLARKNDIFNKISDNKNINLYYRKTIPIIGGTNEFNNFLFKNNLASPLAQNVLIGALFESLQMGFKNIIIYGADHSWHENYSLGADNILYTEDRHFYDKDKKNLKPHIDEYGVPVRVHEEFFNLYRAFRIYDSLFFYAKKISANVINKSSKTWIDVFPRK